MSMCHWYHLFRMDDVKATIKNKNGRTLEISLGFVNQQKKRSVVGRFCLVYLESIGKTATIAWSLAATRSTAWAIVPESAAMAKGPFWTLCFTGVIRV